MRKSHSLALMVAFAAVFNACMANKTRKLPVTPVEPRRVTVPDILEGRRVAVSLETGNARVKGGHHEGLMQGRQLGKYGLSRSQKKLLYENAAQAAGLSFAAELKRQGIDVYWTDPRNIRGRRDLLLTGEVEKVILHTYGTGAMGGLVGSAGGYWEAFLHMYLMLTEEDGGAVLWEGPLRTYAKLSPCPVELDWTMLSIVVQSLGSALGELTMTAVPKGLAELGGGHQGGGWGGSYLIEPEEVTPIEVAARHAAVDLLKKLRD